MLENIKKDLKREKLLVLANIAVMTVTFLVLGTFISVIAFTQTGIRKLEEQAQVTVFFKDDFPEENILQIQQTLQNDDRISTAKYISKETAFSIFTELNKDDPILLESVTSSILPASLEIQTKNINDLSVIAEDMAKLDGIEEIKYFEDVVERFKHWSGIVYTVGFVLTAVFLIISLAVVVLTLRITIHSKGKELEIMKLVGASDDYVKRPLIHQGVFFGVASSLLAGIILLAFMLIIQLTGIFGGSLEFSFLPDVNVHLILFSVILSMILVLFGFALGYLGSLTAIKKYLKY